jgi:hypothetical protein
MCQSFFSVCPTIKTVGGKLVARSSWWAYLTCLGLYSAKVTVDPTRSLVVVNRKLGWLLPSRREIPFADIRCVAYCYQGPSSSAAARWFSEIEEDNFTVGLRLQDQTYIHLFRFRGSSRGTQEVESKAYATQLAKLIGVPLSR